MCCKRKTLRWHGTYLSHFGTCSEESAGDLLPVRLTSAKHVFGMSTNNWCCSVLCHANNSPLGTVCQWDLLTSAKRVFGMSTNNWCCSVLCHANNSPLGTVCQWDLLTSAKHVFGMSTNNWCCSVLCHANNSPPGAGCQWDLLVQNMYLICPRTTDAAQYYVVPINIMY